MLNLLKGIENPVLVVPVPISSPCFYCPNKDFGPCHCVLGVPQYWPYSYTGTWSEPPWYYTSRMNNTTTAGSVSWQRSL